MASELVSAGLAPAGPATARLQAFDPDLNQLSARLARVGATTCGLQSTTKIGVVHQIESGRRHLYQTRCLTRQAGLAILKRSRRWLWSFWLRSVWLWCWSWFRSWRRGCWSWHGGQSRGRSRVGGHGSHHAWLTHHSITIGGSTAGRHRAAAIARDDRSRTAGTVGRSVSAGTSQATTAVAAAATIATGRPAPAISTAAGCIAEATVGATGVITARIAGGIATSISHARATEQAAAAVTTFITRIRSNSVTGRIARSTADWIRGTAAATARSVAGIPAHDRIHVGLGLHGSGIAGKAQHGERSTNQRRPITVHGVAPQQVRVKRQDGVAIWVACTGYASLITGGTAMIKINFSRFVPEFPDCSDSDETGRFGRYSSRHSRKS